ncbi:MAG: type III secretion system cytoplasmic ring protein SctQ [Simkaniaceae bacterium]|nr:type III secretion system cytoplasmic ring protein SctQ [Simkaniaceae bacterium]
MAGADWKEGSDTFDSLGTSPLQLGIALTPLRGSLSLIVAVEDMRKLSSWLIDAKAKEAGFDDPLLQKGFFHYLATETLSLIDTMHIFPKLAPKLIEIPLVEEDAYCLDIAVERGEEIAYVRLTCPPLFRQAFKEHYAGIRDLSLPSERYAEIYIPASVTAGSTTLTQYEVGNLTEGDFVILDDCSYLPEQNRGTCQLIVGESPLFHVKIKDENMKILDYTLCHGSDSVDDETEYEEDSLSFDENTEDEEGTYLEDETDADTDADEDEATEEDEETYYETEEGETEDEEEGETEDEEEDTIRGRESPEKGLISPDRVPVTLSVEVARMQMNLDALLRLKPGGTLDLKVYPEEEVRLVAGGKCVAKGRLVRLGKTIGVKITRTG